MDVVTEIVKILEKHGYEINEEKPGVIKATRKGGAGFIIEVTKESIRIYPDDTHKEVYKDLATEDPMFVEEELNEVSSMIADLKVIAINNSLRFDDRLRPYLEELLEEIKEDLY